MIDRLRHHVSSYPGQFWLMFCGMLISTIGASMIWPFLMLYVSEKLQLPLTTVAGLTALNAAVGVISSFVGGPITDRTGRKWVMASSLITNGMAYVVMSQASSLTAFAILMSITGAVNPLYRVGSDAMMADLIPREKRPDAYALLRLSNNVGVAIGPAVGGAIAVTSYSVAFYCAAAGMVFYGLLVALVAKETLPQMAAGEREEKETFGGYGRILQDRRFMPFVGALTTTQMCATLIWILMAVYAKKSYQVPENLYGLIPTTNALMVVLFQVAVTQFTKRHHPLKMLTVGALFYAMGVGSVALAQGFWGFWLSMVIMTVGELILMPTSSTFAANLAPADMRGRYMSIYGLTWPVAMGIAPVAGGFLSDTLGPVTTWYGGFVAGLISTVWFAVLYRQSMRQPASAASGSTAYTLDQ